MTLLTVGAVGGYPTPASSRERLLAIDVPRRDLVIAIVVGGVPRGRVLDLNVTHVIALIGGSRLARLAGAQAGAALRLVLLGIGPSRSEFGFPGGPILGAVCVGAHARSVAALLGILDTLVEHLGGQLGGRDETPEDSGLELW